MRKIKATVNNSGNDTDEDIPWYWKNGLHDAEIIKVNKMEFPYDYKTRSPIRNCLEIFLNSSQALYSKIKTIYLYNYEIVCGDIKASAYWMCDTLIRENNKFILKITFVDIKNEYDVVVSFEKAEAQY